MQLDVYRCDAYKCHGNVPKDFGHKEYFRGHQKRLHGVSNGQEIDEAFQRCRIQMRNPPLQSLCGFCGDSFHGASSWDRRLHHVGRHLMEGDQLEKETEDVFLRNWALEEGVLEIVHDKFQLVGLANVHEAS
ncbi:uncharacterized protein N7483_011104 [Penicillium malachiteum]|uniref:uncharacterized protein n=1 Tax=Penicillium malachiteum TaxID=1324776 RepID=UPI0025493FD3|nr:uncharacterized protein N7483_011104 [Penicillium malachiteum]KAJ5713923.1 hypothetical protein N7483_011104 [Penicillium malachiteum]